MVSTRGSGKNAALGALVLFMFAACGGQSNETRAAAGSGGGAAGSLGGACVYNGVRYVAGERFGGCKECSCVNGGVSCDPLDCMPGVPGPASGSGGLPAGSAERSTGGGAPSSGGAGNSAGAATAGANTGAAGAGNACQLATIGSLCVLGTPAADGQDLVVGAPLTVSLQPAGCYSSSCTQLVSSSCNYLGSDGTFWISGFICLAREGDICTDDCGGAHAVSCAPGVTLEARQYTVGLGGTSKSVSFTVPSHVPDSALCLSISDEK